MAVKRVKISIGKNRERQRERESAEEKEKRGKKSERGNFRPGFIGSPQPARFLQALLFWKGANFTRSKIAGVEIKRERERDFGAP